MGHEMCGYCNHVPCVCNTSRNVKIFTPEVAKARKKLEVEATANLLAERDRLREAGRWVLHVANGIGKNGGEPRPGEYEAAIDALKEALESKS